MKDEDPSISISCRCINTVKHFQPAQEKVFRKLCAMYHVDIFEHISHDSIIAYVKGADLYYKICMFIYFVFTVFIYMLSQYLGILYPLYLCLAT